MRGLYWYQHQSNTHKQLVYVYDGDVYRNGRVSNYFEFAPLGQDMVANFDLSSGDYDDQPGKFVEATDYTLEVCARKLVEGKE